VKLFYLINEPVLNYQVGYRAVIKKLIEKKILADCCFYSFYIKLAEFDFQRELFFNDLVKEIIEFSPDAILFAHTGSLKFEDSFFTEVASGLGYRPIYALDERDVYGKFAKKLPLELLQLSAKCDITFLVCSGGWMFQKFQKYNKGRSVYLPHVCDDIHFGKRKPNGTTKKYDVVMIGNLAKSKIPFNSMPGVQQRIKVAKALYKRNGNRFAVFGYGWDKYPFAAGTVPYFEQEEVLHSSHLSIGVDHFLSYDQYFSDRLPIALASGVPHISWKTPHLDLLFEEGQHILYCKTETEAVIKSDKILSGGVSNLAQQIAKAKNLVETEFTETKRMVSLLSKLEEFSKGGDHAR